MHRYIASAIIYMPMAHLKIAYLGIGVVVRKVLDISA